MKTIVDNNRDTIMIEAKSTRSKGREVILSHGPCICISLRVLVN